MNTGAHDVLFIHRIYIYIQVYVNTYIYIYIYVYQGAPGVIRIKTGLVLLRSRLDWVTLVRYFHGFTRVGFGQVSC